MMHHFYETRVRGMVMSEQDGSIIALLQINPTVGDLTGNAQRLEHFIQTATAHGAVGLREHRVGHLWLPSSRFVDAIEFC